MKLTNVTVDRVGVYFRHAEPDITQAKGLAGVRYELDITQAKGLAGVSYEPDITQTKGLAGVSC